MFQILRFTFDFGLIAVVAYLVWTVYSGYRAATGTTWERLLAGARGSATILSAKFCAAVSLVVSNLDTLADAAGQPELKGYIDQAIGNPKIVAIIMLSMSALFTVARLRRLTS